MKFFKRLISMYGFLILDGFIDLIINANWDWIRYLFKIAIFLCKLIFW